LTEHQPTRALPTGGVFVCRNPTIRPARRAFFMPAGKDDMTHALNAALEYARKGWAIFPLVGKRPATKNGFHDATTDREQLERWFRDEGYPNVGLAIPEGHWVLDVDRRNGGDATLEAIRDQLPTDTRVHETGGG